MSRYATELGASPGRGAYAEAREGGRILTECRELLCRLFGAENPNHVIFTLNASDALNLAIHGLVRPGDHVITTWLEHNSVLRPLSRLGETDHVEQTRVECDPVTGLVDPDDIRRAIRPRTRLVVVVHGSNVTGTLQPVAEIGRITRERGIVFLVDAAQTAGHVPLDVQAAGIDLLALPGHKGLLGPLGTGALYIRPGIEQQLHTVREGGTGSASDRDVQPDWLPDRFEPGSHNALGIAGWLEGVRWILERGIDQVREHEERLMRSLLERPVRRSPDYACTDPRRPASASASSPCASRDFADPQALSRRLEQDFGILTRSGLHCAPLAHRTIGTADSGGTTRLSLGPFVTERDVGLGGRGAAPSSLASPSRLERRPSRLRHDRPVHYHRVAPRVALGVRHHEHGGKVRLDAVTKPQVRFRAWKGETVRWASASVPARTYSCALSGISPLTSSSAALAKKSHISPPPPSSTITVPPALANDASAAAQAVPSVPSAPGGAAGWSYTRNTS